MGPGKSANTCWDPAFELHPIRETENIYTQTMEPLIMMKGQLAGNRQSLCSFKRKRGVSVFTEGWSQKTEVALRR